METENKGNVIGKNIRCESSGSSIKNRRVRGNVTIRDGGL